MFSISEDEGIRFCLPQIKSSGKYKIRFKFETVDHPSFGTSKYLQGEIPLFHCKQSLPISNFFAVDKTEQDKLIQDSIQLLRPIFEDLDEDDLKKVVIGFIVGTGLTFPRFDVSSSTFDMGLQFIVGAFFIDDKWDENGISANDGFMCRMIWRQISSDQDKRYTLETYERVVEHTEDFHPALYTLCKGVSDKLRERFHNKENVSLGLAHRLFYALEGAELMHFTEEGPQALSEETLAYVRGHDSGVEVLLEFYVAFQEIHVHEFIRNTVVFQLLVQKVREFGALLNDIFGLPKDMQIEGYDNNAILRRILREGISMEQSFQDALNRLLNMSTDLNGIIQRTRQSFPGEKDVEAYIVACMDMCDGQILNYLFSSKFKGARYPSLKIQLVEMD